jgi:hypothetical protein
MSVLETDFWNRILMLFARGAESWDDDPATPWWNLVEASQAGVANPLISCKG